MSENNSNEEYNNSYANQVNEIINTLELDSETDRSILKVVSYLKLLIMKKEN